MKNHLNCTCGLVNVRPKNGHSPEWRKLTPQGNAKSPVSELKSSSGWDLAGGKQQWWERMYRKIMKCFLSSERVHKYIFSGHNDYRLPLKRRRTKNNRLTWGVCLWSDTLKWVDEWKRLTWGKTCYIWTQPSSMAPVPFPKRLGPWAWGAPLSRYLVVAIHAGVQEDLDHGFVTIPCCQVQGRVLLSVAAQEVGVCIQEHLHHLQSPVQRCQVQRCLEFVVAHGGVC